MEHCIYRETSREHGGRVEWCLMKSQYCSMEYSTPHRCNDTISYLGAKKAIDAFSRLSDLEKQGRLIVVPECETLEALGLNPSKLLPIAWQLLIMAAESTPSKKKKPSD